MEFIILKNSDLKVSRLCMGGCPMGGYGWGKIQESELINAVHMALENEVNFFDTADTYGLGQAEITLGKALAGKRNRVIIQSKFGVCVRNGKTIYDNSPGYIQKALEQSLKRLRTDYIDLYVIHYRDKTTPIADVVEKLLQLQQQGKIRHFGLSNIHDDGIKELLPYKGLFVSCQNEYSLACRENEKDFDRLRELLNVTPMTWGSLGQGILTGKYTKDNVNFGADDRRSRDVYVNFHGEKLKKNLEIVETMRPIARKYNVSIAAVAIRFILDYLKDSIVLAGVKKTAQIISNSEAFGWHLQKEEIETLQKVSEI